MNPFADYLQNHWLAVALVLATSALAGRMFLVRARRGSWSIPWLLPCAALFCFILGGLGFLPFDWALWGTVVILGLFALLLANVFITGLWSAPLGYVLGTLLIFGIGALTLEPCTRFLENAARFLWSVEPLEPQWLLLLLLVPAIVWLSFRSLSGLGPVRKWVAIGLRCLLISLLALALAETHARKPDKNVTVLFVWDRSLSVPPEMEGDVDRREERLKNFISEAVAKRGAGKEGDRTGVILFGRRPRLELPPASVPKLQIAKFQSPVDDTYTDIAAAIKLALASFPEGSGKRVVLYSDGNENIGQAEEQARLAKQNGVQIDVVPLAGARRNPNEVLVERVEAPPSTEKDSRLPLRIVLRSYHPEIVVGTLQLIKSSLDMNQQKPAFREEPLFTAQVKLKSGLNVFYYQQPGSSKEDAYTYEAKFIPAHVENARGKVIQEGFPGDRVENNRASVSVMSRGQRALLFIETRPGEHKLLVDRLQKSRPNLKIVAITPKNLPRDPNQFAFVLSKFDAVVLANVPAENINDEGLSDEQQKVLRSNTHDQGAGLITIGGPQSFGAGGWQGTELEKAWPVQCDLKSIKVEGKSGLVLIMHASEMADGNAWQRKIAKLAIEKLSPMDMVGVLYYDHGFGGGGGMGGHTWHIEFKEIADQKATLIAKLDKMNPGDMPDADPSLTMAHGELTKREYALGTKHIIFISDGDHWIANPALLAKVRASKITCTTVCITTHGQDEIKKMAFVAAVTGGRSYHIKDPSELPAIYIKETRLVSQSFVHEKRFPPQLRLADGPTKGLDVLPDLYGFVRTTRRPSPLVEVPIETPKLGDAKFPILATWQYGLGKSVAFTSDARSLLKEGFNFWDKDWASSDMHGKFWEQTVDWAMRSVETGKHLNLVTEHKDGKIRIIVEANDNDADKTPLTNVELKAGISSPTFKGPDAAKVEVKFEQKSAGVYEAEFQADEVGSYFLNIQAKWKKKDGKIMEEKTDSVRAGVTIPYSPEFAEMESNSALLDRLRELTGGKSYDDDQRNLSEAAHAGDVFRPTPAGQYSLQPLWHWLVLLAGVCLLFDVAVRRIALEPAVVWGHATTLWSKLRRREVPEAATVFLERLKTRKAQVEESLEKKKAGKRFEAAEGARTPVPEASAAPTAPAEATKKPAPPEKTQKEEEPADFATRLMRAKKKAMEDRDKDKPK